MIVSKNKVLIDKIRDYREFDMRIDNISRFNFQMTDLQAAIGRVQLKKLPSFINKREHIFKMYKNAGLNLLDVTENECLQPVRFRAVLQTENPQLLIQKLAINGVKSIVPIEEEELLFSTPNAVELSKKTISLPIYP